MSKGLNKTRCSWLLADKPDHIAYHDLEWGVLVHDDRHFFEMLCLEGTQAGVSWYTIRQRHEGYRKAFKNFEPVKCAKMTNAELEKALTSGNIIRNRLKVFSVSKNAQAFLEIQKEFGSFDAYR
jgi:DNA-3-methyladenine glycosylase I